MSTMSEEKNPLSSSEEKQLFIAIKGHNLAEAKTLLQREPDVNFRNSDGETPLIVAVVANNLELVRLLVAKGAKTDYKDLNGNNPLHFASTAFMVSVLLKESKGTPLENKNSAGRTPLQQAVLLGNIEVAKRLLFFKAEVEVADFDQNSLLHSAVRGARDNAECVNLVLSELKGDITPILTPNSDGLSPLRIVADALNKDTFLLLASHLEKNVTTAPQCDQVFSELYKICATANLNPIMIGEIYNQALKIFEKRRTFGKDSASDKIYQVKLLCMAIINKDAAVVKTLAKIDLINHKDEFGNTPIHYAAKAGNSGILKLLGNKQNYTIPNNAGNTPLLIAAISGHLECIRTILPYISTKVMHHRNHDGHNVLECLLNTFSKSDPTFQSKLIPVLLEFHTLGFKPTAENYERAISDPELRKQTQAIIESHLRLFDPTISLRSEHKLPATEIIFDAKTETLEDQLYEALKNRDAKKAQELINVGANVDGCNSKGVRMLQIAAKSSEMFRLLVKNCASLNETFPHGQTPLHIAAGFGKIQTVLFYLNREAEQRREHKGATPPAPVHLNTKNDKGQTALDCVLARYIKVLGMEYDSPSDKISALNTLLSVAKTLRRNGGEVDYDKIYDTNLRTGLQECIERVVNSEVCPPGAFFFAMRKEKGSLPPGFVVVPPEPTSIRPQPRTVTFL